MILRVGIPEVNGSLLKEAKIQGYPIMISVSRLWRKKTARFARPGKGLEGLDLFLDSAGFTAQSQWGGYPWSPAQYLDVVSLGRWAHWSQMDCCCEPQIAADQAEVRRRIRQTAEYLEILTHGARDRGIADPLPVLQGWTPANYALSASLADSVLGGVWPDLIGIGSVCRREVHGTQGVVAIVEALDPLLPKNVKMHLFGVKSGALRILKSHPRVASTDSMAWDFAVRMECRRQSIPFSMDRRIAGLNRWVLRQRAILDDDGPAVSSSKMGQLTLF